MAKRSPKASGDSGGTKGRRGATARRKPAGALRPAKARAKKSSDTVYQVKITLNDVEPPVWRRVLVRDCSLARLHDVIQASMGWEDYHLHLFEVRGERYGDPEQWRDDMWGGDDVRDEGKAKLSHCRDKGIRKLLYEYDMGDGWRHTLMIEKAVPAEAGVRYPRCVDGARACPPEDCGGPWGYMDLLQALEKPLTERQEELLEWIGGAFDADAFDPDLVNEELSVLP
jgi:hypothetical protein